MVIDREPVRFSRWIKEAVGLLQGRPSRDELGQEQQSTQSEVSTYALSGETDNKDLKNLHCLDHHGVSSGKMTNIQTTKSHL